MSLSDPKYIGFLFAVFACFYALPRGGPRRLLLLAASYFFYFTLSGFFLAVLLYVTAVAYGGALLLRSRPAAERGSLLFWLAGALLLAPLVAFKYLGSNGLGLFALALPVGISFFTFTGLGYLIDVYLEVLEPEPRLDRAALFLAFFPLVSAGPIERAGRLLPQFELETPFSADRAFSALRLILTGLVLKVYFAELLALPADAVFAAPASFSALDQLCGAVFYSFYLYADFAGYSLLAIGSARLLGLEVRPNFQQPFLSATVPEFWRNWHISLSSWVRDYLFTPLRTEWRRRGAWGLGGALFVSFLVIGLWHGARWGWLAFGAIHGTLVVLSTFTLARRNALWQRLRVPPAFLQVLRVVATFLLVSLAFVVCRASSLAEAFGMYRSIFSPRLLGDLADAGRWLASHRGAAPPLAAIQGVKAWELIAVLVVGDLLARRKFTWERFPALLQVGAYNFLIVLVLFQWWNENGSQSFAYYKF